MVDDDQSALKLADETLRRLGFRTVCRHNAAGALKAVSKERPAAVVLDVVMPGRNGFQACRDLKADERFKGIPVVLCTSKGQESDKFWGQQQGGNAYIVKPFKGEDLVATVKKVLN